MVETRKSLRERWQGPDWRGRLPQVRDAIAAGSVTLVEGLGRHEGRVDLRGFPAAGVPVGLSSPASGMVVEHIAPISIGEGSCLEGIDFAHAGLSSWRLMGASIVDCVFDKAECADWRVWGTRIERSSFQGADLRDSALAADDKYGVTSWIDVDFSAAKLNGSAFTRGHLERCRFAAPGLRGVHWVGNRLVDVSFSGLMSRCKVDQRHLTPGRLPPVTQRLDFSEAVFDDISFDGLHSSDLALPEGRRMLIVDHMPDAAVEALGRLEGDDALPARRVRAVLKGRLKAWRDDESQMIIDLEDLLGDDPEQWDAWRRAFPGAVPD